MAVALSFGFGQEVGAGNALLRGLSSSPDLKADGAKGLRSAQGDGPVLFRISREGHGVTHEPDAIVTVDDDRVCGTPRSVWRAAVRLAESGPAFWRKGCRIRGRR